MKKIIVAFSGAVLGITTVMAQNPVATLEHNGQTQPFYGTSALVDANNAAVKNDVIYLSTGHFNPPTINKTLKIVGAGHYADSSKAFLRTIIDGAITLNGGSDSASIEGLYISGDINFGAGAAMSGVRIFRCYVGNIYFRTNSAAASKDYFTISECIIGSLVCYDYCKYLIITNNIINGGISTIDGNNGSSASISNNIFLYNSYDYVFSYIYNSLINNNIFLVTTNTAAYVVNRSSSCLFKNNLFVYSSFDFGTTNSSVNNYFGVAQANIFINQTGNSFNYTHNYHLKNPTQYLGDDGTEIGIYGGMSPYKEKAIPTNPYIEQNVIATKTDLNGNLQINIKAKAQNK